MKKARLRPLYNSVTRLTAHVAAPPVEPELRLTSSQAEELVRGEHRVLEESVHLAVQAVGPRLQAHVDRSAAHEARTGIERRTLNLKLFDDTRRRGISNLRALHVGRAVHHELVAS
jgi:hypothetical protein